ncbi:MAG: polyribonucleotide nucleotidyltransferase [Enterobacteriaceae bacterium]
MLQKTIQQFKYGNSIIKLETGTIARQSNAAVMISMGDTTVLITVVNNLECNLEKFVSFLPLTVNYQERAYSAGKFPGNFFRREGRPSEKEVLVSRLIDRSIRPLFSLESYSEIQIIATVLSIDPQINPDIVSIIGVSAALTLSDIPFKGPIGAARIGYINNQYILNPTTSDLKNSKLNLIVTGNKDSVLMVESEINFLNEEQILEAIIYGHKQQQIIIDNIFRLSSSIGKDKSVICRKSCNSSIKKEILKFSKENIKNSCEIYDKKTRLEFLKNIKNEVLKNFFVDKEKTISEVEIENILFDLRCKIVRSWIIKNHKHIDGRFSDSIRDIEILIGILPRTHGSALFTRGDTQALVTVTLGTEKNAQNVEDFMEDRIERFILHYNFHPYCVGEIGVLGAPKRREIGHGRLAKKAINSIIPNSSEFPYTLRIVSEITESNGSSSMASVCGASLALMDAGVPVKTHIAGISMGLIKNKSNFVILSDILGDEDHIGDMDFKISGGINGFTAMQMDIKSDVITFDILNEVLLKSKIGISKILDTMNGFINKPNKNISKFAPRIYSIFIKKEKIKDIIGKGGSVIKSITESTKTDIEISDNGTVKIISKNEDNAKNAIKMIREIISDVKIGDVYNGKVTRIVEFGAFVSFRNYKEGLVHISQISKKYVDKVSDHLKIGQPVLVKVLDIDRNGRIKLSIKSTKQTIKKRRVL